MQETMSAKLKNNTDAFCRLERRSSI